MQFSTIFTILAAAMTATAIPTTRLLARGDDGDVVCSADGQAVCCNGFAAACALTVAAKNCEISAYCCEAGNDVVQNGLINANVNCIKVL